VERRLAIDFRSPEPSYRQLANQLREAIISGEIAPGEALPSLAQLVAETGLSKSTVQRAVRELTAEGLVRSVSGRGRFVTPRD
jgi:DNA-binding GntR family transcriptional regulator